MLLLRENFWPVVYYLLPGMLLGFGLAVFPHRERLGRGMPPARRRMLQAAPAAALHSGCLLMAATLLLHRAG